jgi:ABC-type xylose transport system permease subunit
MGNLPQGSKFAYAVAATFFALLMGYILFCTVWLTVKDIQGTIAALDASRQTLGQGFIPTATAILRSRIFRQTFILKLARFHIA